MSNIGQESSLPSISRGRVWMVYSLAAVIVLGHVYEIISQDEHWPFSPYPMYSALRRSKNLLDVQIVGVPANADAGEILFDNPAWLSPLPANYLRNALQQSVLRARAGDPRWRDGIARDVLALYERRRSQGLHRGPALEAVRVYELRWVVDDRASNADRPQRVLVSEAKFPADVRR